MNNQQLKSQIVTGYVERVKPRFNEYSGGYAIVIIPELGGRQLTVPDNCGPFFINTGPDDQPLFLKSSPVTGVPKVKGLCPTDEVVLEVSGVNGAMKVLACGHAYYWRKAEEEISRRPLYRVLRENRFHGQVMKASARSEEFFVGSLKKLMAEHPRDGLRVSANDKLAPVYKTGPATALNRFEIRQNGANWAPCEDPRPFPAGKTYRLMHWQDGKSRQLSIGTALEINWRFERGDKDPLAKYDSIGESNGYLYWERYEGTVNEGKSQWTEVADPRPEPAKEKVHAKDSPSAKFEARYARANCADNSPRPVAMQKKPESERVFHASLKSLADLVLH